MSSLPPSSLTALRGAGDVERGDLGEARQPVRTFAELKNDISTRFVSPALVNYSACAQAALTTLEVLFNAHRVDYPQADSTNLRRAFQSLLFSLDSRDNSRVALLDSVNTDKPWQKALGICGGYILVFGGLALLTASAIAYDTDRINVPKWLAITGLPVSIVCTFTGLISALRFIFGKHLPDEISAFMNYAFNPAELAALQQAMAQVAPPVLRPPSNDPAAALALALRSGQPPRVPPRPPSMRGTSAMAVGSGSFYPVTTLGAPLVASAPLDFDPPPPYSKALD